MKEKKDTEFYVDIDHDVPSSYFLVSYACNINDFDILNVYHVSGFMGTLFICSTFCNHRMSSYFVSLYSPRKFLLKK